MNDWLHSLPVIWMAVVVCGVTSLITAAIYAVVMVLATGERARAFKAVSPGILSSLISHQNVFAIQILLHRPIIHQLGLALVPFRNMRPRHDPPRVPLRP